MARRVSTADDLGKALKDEADTIEITGDLAKKTITLRATGKVAWAVVYAALVVSVGAGITLVATGGATAIPAGVTGIIAAPAAVAILGSSVTYSAIMIAIAAGGVGSLTKLRNYKEISRSSYSLTLQRI